VAVDIEGEQESDQCIDGGLFIGMGRITYPSSTSPPTRDPNNQASSRKGRIPGPAEPAVAAVRMQSRASERAEVERANLKWSGQEAICR